MLLLIEAPAIGPNKTRAASSKDAIKPITLLLPLVIISAMIPTPRPASSASGRHTSCRNLTPAIRSGKVISNHATTKPILQAKNLLLTLRLTRTIISILTSAKTRTIAPPNLLIIPEPVVRKAPSIPFSRIGISDNSTM